MISPTHPTCSNNLRFVELNNVSFANEQQSLHAFDLVAKSCIKRTCRN